MFRSMTSMDIKHLRSKTSLLKKEIKSNTRDLETLKDIRYFYYKNFFSYRKLIKYRFRKYMGREVELINPVSFNDTLHWLFFFSSRRRHTRLQGDWSSDVCSSD